MMPARPDGQPPPDRYPVPDPFPLALLTLGIVVLAAADVLPVWPGLLLAVGLPPLGLAADLRVAVTGAVSYPVFLALVVLAIGVRTLVLATMLGPLRWSTVGFVLRFQLLALPLAAVAAAASFAAGATLFYLLFWVGAVATILEALLLGAVPWTGERSVWRALVASARRGFHLGAIGAYLVALVLLGAIADLGATVATYLMVPVSAALTYGVAYTLAVEPSWAWLRPARGAVALAGLGAVVGLVLVVVTGPASPADGDPLDEPRPGSLLLMSGVDSASGSGAALEIDPRTLGFTCEQTYYYSYAGVGDGQPQNDARCPIRTGAPYGPGHTFGPTDELASHFVDQVEDLAGPVTVVTHSQGIWIVWKALTDQDLPDVRHAALVGPFADNPIGYPADRAQEPGRVGTEVVDHVVGNLARPGGTSGFTYDSPLAVELLGNPAETEEILAVPLPAHVDAVSIASTFDLPLMRRTPGLDGTVEACPVAVAHPNLPYADGFRDAVNDLLDGTDPAPCPTWRTGVGPLLRPFAAPPNA
jgi:hypothetical protein